MEWIKCYRLNQVLLSVLLVGSLISNCFGQLPEVREEALVQKFYSKYRKPLFWFSSDQNIQKATEWLTMIACSRDLGILSDKLQSDQIRVALLTNKNLDFIYKEQRDRQITGWVLNFIKELHEGNVRFAYDGVNSSRDSFYIDQLLN